MTSQLVSESKAIIKAKLFLKCNTFFKVPWLPLISDEHFSITMELFSKRGVTGLPDNFPIQLKDRLFL